MASGSTPATPLLYSAIAYKDTILAEHTTSAAAGTVATKLAALVLPKITHTAAQKLTYEHNDDLVHYVADAAPSSRDPAHLSAAGLTYLVVAKRPLGKRVPFTYLLATKQRFLKDYDPERTDFASLPAYGAAAFNVQLKRLMQEFASGSAQGGDLAEGGDAFASVQAELDSVRGIMTENIERVLERGERIDLLVDKTDRLGGSATDFRVRSRGLRRKMWWKNVRLMVLLAVVIVFLIYLLVGFGCGLPSKLSQSRVALLSWALSRKGDWMLNGIFTNDSSQRGRAA
jgi:vesicle-associated membrane protein 7